MPQGQRGGASARIKPRKIDVRFLAATNRDLEAETARGAFRRDLYFRLAGITLTIPPLRARVGEIRRLAETFVQQICRELGRPEPGLPASVMALLEAYSWPGNIRELKNVMERAVLLCAGPVIDTEHLPMDKLGASPSNAGLAVAPAVSEASQPGVPPSSTPPDERQRIIDALCRVRRQPEPAPRRTPAFRGTTFISAPRPVPDP